MPIAVFRNKTFQVSGTRINTFDGLSWGGDIQVEEQEKLNSKPSTYIKGVGLDSMSYEIRLSWDLGMNVRKEIEEWEAIKLSMQPAIFMLGNKPLGANKWLLKSTNISNTKINNKGNLLSAVLKLEFAEFVRPGSVGTSSSSKSSTKVSSKSSSKKAVAVSANLNPSNYIYKPPTKTEQKRSNPNLANAVAINRAGGR